MMPIAGRATVRAAVLIALGLAGGCTSVTVMSHVPISTLSRLSTLRLADIDPVALRVAARLPEALEPRPGGVKVHIEVSSKQAGGVGTLDLVLEAAAERSELAPLAGHQRTGHRLWVYRLAPADADRVKRLIGEAGGASSVSISAGVEACHRRPIGTAPLPTTTYLRTNTADYLVLTADLDLRRIVSETDLATRVPPCN